MHTTHPVEARRRLSKRSAAAILLLVTVLGAGACQPAIPGGTGISATGTRNATLWPFSATSFWNTPIGTGATFEGPFSARTANLLDRRVMSWVNAGDYSIPVYRAKSTDPFVSVSVRSGGTFRFQMPAGATPARGTDRHIVVIEPNGRYANEAWDFQGSGTSRTAGHFKRIDLQGSGIDGVRGIGVSALGGLIREWEVNRGEIRHALALAIHQLQYRSPHVWPAKWEVSGSGQLNAGMLVAIPPSVNVETMPLTREGRIVARALQRYGAYLVDGAGAFVLYAEPHMETSAAVRNLRNDMAKLRQQLRVVTNNGPRSVGGGGTPKQPLAPAFG